MIYRDRHRLMGEIEKRRKYGENLIFLSGDAVHKRDTYFYDLYHGVLSLADSLKQFYLSSEDADSYDRFIHIYNSLGDERCYSREKGEIRYTGTFKRETKKDDSLGFGIARRERSSTMNKQAQNQVNEHIGQSDSFLKSFSEVLGQSRNRYVVFLENLEWIAKLHNDPLIELLGKLRDWGAHRNLLLIISISDMKLLADFAFNEEPIYIGYPSALEIFYAYYRHLLRHESRTGQAMDIDLRQLDLIAHGLGAGRKTLKACMRILHRILAKEPQALSVADFADGFEKGITEKVAWSDVLLKKEIKNQIMTTLDSFIAASKREKGEKSSTVAQKGLILSGFPGTGKTLIAKALANEKNCHFMAPTLAELKGEYVGQSSARVRRIFAEARANQPTILFVDEADTVFPGRQLGGNDRDSFGLEMVNQFLQEIDGAKSGGQQIFTIAASNRPDCIDSAICSRLGGTPIDIPLPDPDLRGELFDSYISKYQDEPFSLKGKFYEDEVLRKSDGMAGRDIFGFVAKLKDLSPEPLRNDEESRCRFLECFKREEEFLLTGLKSLLSSENIIAPRDNKFSYKDFSGLDQAKKEVNRQVSYLKSGLLEREKYKEYGIKAGMGLLFHGSSGNGKSFFAECAAGEHGFYLIRVLRKDLLAQSMTAELKKLETIFTEIRRFSRMLPRDKGIILFFDDFENLVGKEQINPAIGSALLNYLSNEKWLRDPESRIIFMAAVGADAELDAAFLRRGRIDSHIYVPNPDKESAIAYLGELLKKDQQLYLADKDLPAQIYERLTGSMQRAFLRGMKNNQHWHRLSEALKEEELQKHSPTIADLAALCKQLKEAAFWMQSFEENKLRIDKKVLDSILPVIKS